jgi:hypothetical protein
MTTALAVFAMMLIALSLMAVLPSGVDAEGGPMATAVIPEPEDYLYVMTTDKNNVQITGVKASVGGSPLEAVYAETNGTTFSSFWSFDERTGLGPFNAFYAAINVDEGNGSDSGERQLKTAPGTIAFVLDPYDLSKTLMGTEFAGKYNVMLVVPKVFWRAEEGALYMSSSSEYDAGGTIYSGMVAYAHSGGDNKSFDGAFPYIGIGVYEASLDDGRLVSVSGVKPKTSETCDKFRGYAANLEPASGSDYQLWNFYQWTLYKMMSYTVMGTKNSQSLMGAGPVNNRLPSITGSSDAAGPYGVSTSAYSKLFIENAWGSAWEFVGDAYFKDRRLFTGDSTGGSQMGQQTVVPGAVLSTPGYICKTFSDSEYWDLPTLS